MYRIAVSYRMYGVSQAALGVDTFEYENVTATITDDQSTGRQQKVVVTVEYEADSPNGPPPKDLRRLLSALRNFAVVECGVGVRLTYCGQSYLDLDDPDAKNIVTAIFSSRSATYEKHYDEMPAPFSTEERKRFEVRCSQNPRWEKIVQRLSDGLEEMRASDYEEATRRFCQVMEGLRHFLPVVPQSNNFRACVEGLLGHVPVGEIDIELILSARRAMAHFETDRPPPGFVESAFACRKLARWATVWLGADRPKK